MRIFIALILVTMISGCDSSQTAQVPTGMLKTRDYMITMYAGQDGYNYTVQNLEGETIESGLTLQTMIARFPELEFIESDGDNLDWAGLDELRI